MDGTIGGSARAARVICSLFFRPDSLYKYIFRMRKGQHRRNGKQIVASLFVRRARTPFEQQQTKKKNRLSVGGRQGDFLRLFAVRVPIGIPYCRLGNEFVLSIDLTRPLTSVNTTFYICPFLTFLVGMFFFGLLPSSCLKASRVGSVVQTTGRPVFKLVG